MKPSSSTHANKKHHHHHHHHHHHPKVLSRIYKNGLRTLHQLILELLTPTLSASKHQQQLTSGSSISISVYDGELATQPEVGDGGEWSLIRPNDPPELVSLLEDSFAAITEGAPAAPAMFSLENRFSQKEVVLRAIEVQFQKARRPLHVLCSGYRQPCPFPNSIHQGTMLQGFESVYRNTTFEVVTSNSWSVLLSRVGDMLMLYLLSHTCIFIPLPNNCYLQVAGYPLSLSASSQQIYSTSSVQTSGISRKRKQCPESKESDKKSRIDLEIEEDIKENPGENYAVACHTLKESEGHSKSLDSNVHLANSAQTDGTVLNCNKLHDNDPSVESQDQLPQGPAVEERIMQRGTNCSQNSPSKGLVMARNTAKDRDVSKNSQEYSGNSLTNDISREFVSRERSTVRHSQILKCGLELGWPHTCLEIDCLNDIQIDHELPLTQDILEGNREDVPNESTSLQSFAAGDAFMYNKSNLGTTSRGSPVMQKKQSQQFSRPFSKSSKQKQWQAEKMLQGMYYNQRSASIGDQEDKLCNQDPCLNSCRKTKSECSGKQCIDANGLPLTSTKNHRQHVNFLDRIAWRKRRLIDRKPIFYRSKFPRYPGLPVNHILIRCKANNNGALYLYKHIFKSSEEIMSKLLSEDITKLPVFDRQRFEFEKYILKLLRNLLSNARHCQYGRLLRRHCPLRKASFEFDTGNSSAKNISPSKYSIEQAIKMVDADVGVDEGYLTQEDLATDCCSVSSSDESGVLESEVMDDALLKNPRVKVCPMGDADDLCDTSASEPSSGGGHVGCTIKESLKPEFQPSNKEAMEKEQNIPVSLEKLLSNYTIYQQVVSFLWAVCRRIIPEDLLGSHHNWRTLRRSIACFVGLQRYEVFSLEHCLHKFKISELPWLQFGQHDSISCKRLPVSGVAGHRGKAKVSAGSSRANNPRQKPPRISPELKLEAKSLAATEHVFQQRRLEDWLFWIFEELLVPLIQSHFYVTERENHRQLVFYYRKPVWETIKSKALFHLTKTVYRKIPPDIAAEILSKRMIGVPQVRLLPKKNGIRPIAKLGSASKFSLRIQSFSQVNPVQKDQNRRPILKNMSFGSTTIAGKHESSLKHHGSAEKRGKLPQNHVSCSTGPKRNTFFKCCKAGATDSLSFSKTTTTKKFFRFRPVNCILQDIHQCLKYEQRRHPEDVGFSVFDYNDVYSKLLTFISHIKNLPGGVPELFMAVCDVAKAFDTIKQDKLCDILRTFIREQQYFVVRFTSVTPTAHSVRVFHERACTLAGEDRSFLELASSMALKRPNAIFTDQVYFSRISREQILDMVDEHVRRNLLQMDCHSLHQMIGIPQGSVLSPLMCSIYYGHLELQHLLPMIWSQSPQSSATQQGSVDKSSSILHNRTSRKRKASVLSEVPQSCEDEAQLILATSFSECERCCFIPKDSLCNALSSMTPNSRSFAKPILKKKVGLMKQTWRQCLQSSRTKRHGHEIAFADTSSLLMRMIDDSLLISTSKDVVSKFLMKMHKGFKDYGSYVNEQKTCLNFYWESEGKCIFPHTYQTEDGANFMRWNGLLINCHTLEVQADYTRYCGEDIKTTLTVWRGSNPGSHYIKKLCHFMRPKCHPLFYDQRINSSGTICLNAYQAFMLCAMKSHAYVCSMRPCSQTNTIFLFQAILRTARFMHRLVKQKMLTVGDDCKKFSLTQQELEWLGIHAFYTVLSKKQSRYKELLILLRSRFQAEQYCKMERHPHIISAMDEKRSSMFKHIKY